MSDPRVSYSLQHGEYKTLEGVCSAAVTNPYVVSPINIVVYEVRQITVNARVIGGKWHFEEKK